MSNLHAPSVPAPPTSAPPRRGPDLSSVPKILLGLGALCLLVAAAIFLAVSWSTMGIGARTAVLAGLTLGAVAGSLALLLRRLLIGAEAMSVVSLGLLVLDVYGASASGLVHGLSAGTTTCVAGIVLVLASVSYGLTGALSLPRLIAPQITLGVGLFLAYAGGATAVHAHDLLVGHLVVAVAAGGALTARRAGLPAASWSCLTAATLAWLPTSTLAVSDAIAEPTLHNLWVGGSGWALLVSGAAMMIPGLVLRHRGLLLTGASGTALVTTAVLTLPSLHVSFTAVTLCALAATLVWGTFLALVRTSHRIIGFAPTAVGTLLLIAAVITVLAIDLDRWARLAGRGTFRAHLLLDLRGTDSPVAPWLIVPAALLVAAVLAVVVSGSRMPDLRTWGTPAVLVAGLGAALTTAAYDVALALPAGLVALTAVTASLFAVTARRAETPVYAGVAVAMFAATVLGSLPSAALTAVVAGLGFASMAGLGRFGRTHTVRVAGESALVPLLAVGLPALVVALGHGPAWVAVPLLACVGLVALVRPVPWVELPAGAVAILALPVSLTTVADPLALLSLWLLTAAFLCGATGLLHDDRRPMAGIGAGLLLLAIWIRMADQDVRIAEAYTLPLAIALVAIGLHHLWRHPRSGTAQALLPGLVLATAPSLLLSLTDPISLRALLLGTACLGLVLLGAGLRWSAPLLTGAVVGTLLVLRELGPYAGAVPQWAWIGLAGVVLTTAGITWERQLRDLRRAAHLIGRLR